jgi:hypothetical protein
MTHARPYHSKVFCDAGAFNDPKFRPMAVSAKQVCGDVAAVPEVENKKKSPSLWVEIWKLVKPDLLLLILVAITAIGAAIVNLQTPAVTGKLINVIAKSIQNADSLTLDELKKPAVKLLGLFLSQGKDLFRLNVHVAWHFIDP